MALSRDDNCRTALHWAAASNHSLLCDVILHAANAEREARAAQIAAQADIVAPSDSDPSNLVPTPAALGFHTVPPLKPLLSLPDDRGNTAVHVAARDGCADALSTLLDYAAADGAAVDAGEADPGAADEPPPPASAQQILLMHRNRAGQTALHCAVLGSCPDCVSALAAACPSGVNLADRLGFTPPQLAQRRRCGCGVLRSLGVDSPAAGMANGAGDAAGEHAASRSPPMLLVTSPDCLAHHTAKPPLLRGMTPPPENVRRLEVNPVTPPACPRCPCQSSARETSRVQNVAAGAPGSAVRHSAVRPV